MQASTPSPELKPWQTVVRAEDGTWVPVFSSRKGPPSYYRRGHSTLRYAIMWLKRAAEHGYLVWTHDGGEHKITGPTEPWTGFFNIYTSEFVSGAKGTLLTWLNLPTDNAEFREMCGA